MGRMAMRAWWVSVGLALAVAARAADAPGSQARAAFDRIKGLAGEWKGKGPDGKPLTIVYRVTASGSAVQETLSPGSPMEMVTMYHLDGADLRLTHYCAMGNQPHLKLDRAASKPDELVFAFDGGTNLDPSVDKHMHSGRIRFVGDGRLESSWEGFDGGKACCEMTFTLARP